ncbi:MAG: acyltransferase family protein [Giesbergeria sp.]
MPQTSTRSPWIDATKGVACLAIVLHHLSVYGPLSDSVQPYAPGLLAWLYDYARMAVQVFLVVGGYLAAASLAPEGRARFAGVAPQVARRFVRLAVPYAAALLVAVATAALVRPWLDDPSVPASPQLPQLLANALMLQDLLGQPALSAGVWYVAIDFQLYALAVLLLALARRLSGGVAEQAVWVGKALIVALCAASLLVFNRFEALDAWGIYFFGAYGLGMTTFWAVRSPHRGRWLLALALLGATALALEFRPRIVLAVATGAWLAWLALRPQVGDSALAKAVAAPLAWVGQRSYSVFLVHFSVCLVANAVFAYFWPADPLAHAVGLVVAFAASIAAGWLLYDRVERHGATAWEALRWEARLLGGSLLVTLANSGL